MLKIQNKKFELLIKILFAIYLIILVWALLFKLEFSLDPYIRSINLVPFAAPAVANHKINVSEIILNTAAFIPFGIFISIIRSNGKFILKLLPILITTVLIEALQYIFQIGASDITDVIVNILGGIIGILLYKLLHRIFGIKTDNILFFILLIGTIILIGLIALVKIANL